MLFLRELAKHISHKTAVDAIHLTNLYLCEPRLVLCKGGTHAVNV